jgi:hypothetical protein
LKENFLRPVTPIFGVNLKSINDIFILLHFGKAEVQIKCIYVGLKRGKSMIWG